MASITQSQRAFYSHAGEGKAHKAGNHGRQRRACIYSNGTECPDALYFKGEYGTGEGSQTGPEPVAPRFDGNTGNTGIPDPSAVNCEQMGGTYEIRTNADGGQDGFFIFSDGTECEGWALFRGECKPGATSAPDAGAPLLGGNTGNIGMANPASVYCEENGGTSFTVALRELPDLAAKQEVSA